LGAHRSTHRTVNFTPADKSVLLSILSGSYTPYDVREFVRLCYTLALPLIRKRIVQGRISLESIGLKQVDLVYDCIADLFVRDGAGHFTEVEGFFNKEIRNIQACSDELMWDTLRRIVFAKVNVNLIRLHSGADPAFGKILHNLDVAVTRTGSFEKYVRFGETMLACCECDLLLNLPPPPLEYLREQLAHVVLIQDSVPTMLKKLRTLLAAQRQYQRVVPVLWVGVLLKEVYSLAPEPETEPADPFLQTIEQEEAVRLIEQACADARTSLRPTYVEGGKMTEEIFEKYLQSAHDVLTDLVNGSDGRKPFFEYLRARLPDLTKEEYITRHKPIQEYVIKVARAKLSEKINRDQSAR
jgi:hypothetical protein